MAGADQDQRRALELLAGSPRGCTESIMMAHGFKRAMLAELVRNGWATAATEIVRAGWRPIEVARMRITEAGRRALAQRP
jgi:hypothetical protein